METTDVLVVGAGPTGLALACSLLQHGVSVRVIDRADGPSSTSRANILHARGVEVLHRLGALGDLADTSVSAIKITMHADGRPVMTVQFGEVEGAQLSALICSQAEVEARLRHRLYELGGDVRWRTELLDATEDVSGVTAVARDGTIHAAWLAGCDGAHSVVRKLAGIDFPGAPVAEQFLLADVHMDWDMDRSGTVGWYHRDGVLFAMPMYSQGDDVWRLMADVPLGEPLDEASIVSRFRQLLTRRAAITDAGIRDAAWVSPFRIHRRLATRYRTGRTVLAGDAAHIHSPMGGQGMNTGIGDAENLAWKLAMVVRGTADEALVDTYGVERRPVAKEVLSGTTTATRLQVGDGPLYRFLRDRVMLPLARLPAAQRYATRTASQLSMSYRRGPLGGSPLDGKPRPGDRVPDLPCTAEDGTATRLHAELGGHWVLLTSGEDPGADSEVAVARKWLGAALTVLHAPSRDRAAVRLVRPDAHLAWRGSGADRLERWLAGALRRGGR